MQGTRVSLFSKGILSFSLSLKRERVLAQSYFAIEFQLLNSNETSTIIRILRVFSNFAQRFNSIGDKTKRVIYFPLIVEKKKNELSEKSMVNEIRNGKELYRAITLSSFSIHRPPNSKFGTKGTISFSLSYKRMAPQRNYPVKHWNNTSSVKFEVPFVRTYVPSTKRKYPSGFLASIRSAFIVISASDGSPLPFVFRSTSKSIWE